jgi:hypothetical protein
MAEHDTSDLRERLPSEPSPFASEAGVVALISRDDPPRRNAPWTAEDIERLRSLCAAGKSDEEVSRITGRTLRSVVSRRHRYSVPMGARAKRLGPVGPYEAASIGDMYARGASFNQIVAKFGRGVSSIRQIVQRHGFARDPSFIPDLSPYCSAHEEWRWIPGYVGYAASSLGRIMSMTPGNHGTVLRPYLDRDGYEMVSVNNGRRAADTPVHRLVAFAFIGPPPSQDHQIAHGDGSKRNNRPGNIRWATAQENYDDSIKHGSRAHNGRRHPWVTKP